MIVTINRNGNIICITGNHGNAGISLENIGYKKICISDIDNFEEVEWAGLEYKKLFAKEGILYRFNRYVGKCGSHEFEIEEIGAII